MKTPLRTVLKSFLDHVDDLEARRKLCDDQYEVEFQRLKQLTEQLRLDPEYSCVFGFKEENRPKNRYKDIVPYDFCRVVLPEYAGIPGSEYINASYIKGGSGAFAYIAAQGPLSTTVIDFWRMIWFCDVQVIVMACCEQEGGKTKCMSYWPPSCGDVSNFGKFSVQLVSQTQVCPDFLVRSLLVKQGAESREVWQFHYNTWPDHSVPDTVQPILHLVRLMRELQASETAPILVHCSAGCGRTGTICAIDFIWACLRTGKLDESFSLYEVVANMRRQRIAMVQTKEQYMLVYKAVAEMFSQQLKIIDSHIYENLDKTGHPLIWNGHEKDKTVELTNAGFFNSCVNKTVTMIKSEPKSEKENREDPWIKRESTIGADVDSVTELLDKEKTSVEIGIKEPPKPRGSEENAADLGRSPVSIIKEVENTSDEQKGVDIRLEKTSTVNPHSASSILHSPSSADSIPFIDDDDSKSEIHVRSRCGRAYLHIPSCDSISKIVNRFDPFADVLDIDSSPDAEKVSIISGMYQNRSLSCKCEGRDCPAEVYSDCSSSPCIRGRESLTIKTSDKSDCGKSPTWSSVSQSDLDSKSSVFTMDNNGNDSAQGQNSQCSKTFPSVSSGDEPSERSSCSTNATISSKISRRPSLAKLKNFFEKSPKAKTDDKPTLFRHNSHHVSRAGSAPPSLNCMNKNSVGERESLFGIVSRKFRSSSVKSEQEIRKEAAKTSTISAFKKSAASSLSHIKQNISNISRNVQSMWPKTSGKQNAIPQATWHEANELPENPMEKLADAPSVKRNTISKDKPLKNDKGSSLGITSCFSRPPQPQAVESTDNTQQRFIVNILSSGHSPITPKKHSDLPSSKPSSPKTKNFGVDFDCLKIKTSASSHNGTLTKEQSTHWYHVLEESHGAHGTSEPIPQTLGNKMAAEAEERTTLNRDKAKPSATESLTASTKAKSEFLKQLSFKTRADCPQSKFYTEFSGVKGRMDALVKDSPLPLSEMDKVSVSKSETVGNSKFFWPSNSKTAVKTDAGKKEQVEVIINESSSPRAAEIPPKSDSYDASIESEVKTTQASVIKILISENEKATHESSLKEITSFPPAEKVPEVSNPPALPKKTVIGRNKDKLDIFNIIEPKRNEKLCEKAKEPPVLCPTVKTEEKTLPEIKKEPKTSITGSNELQKRTDNNLYINVNSVAKKNIEQIENTLRSHPRGAIIDLTSRQSYSMEEELASAVNKLPEPVKAKLGNTSKPSGYEVIWPLSSEISSSEGKISQSNEGGNKHLQNLLTKDAAKSKRSGPCYSPPLRRQALNFPVMKSHSCASLAWQQNEMQFIGDDEKEDFKSDSAETLVSEAVVELSTMLDELTTKTLSEDLNEVLKLSASGEKLPAQNKNVSKAEQEMAAVTNNVPPNREYETKDEVNEVEKCEQPNVHSVHVVSLKTVNDEEIVFHFPPPPSMPPPPPVKDSVSETFEVFCKNGVLKVSESSEKTPVRSSPEQCCSAPNLQSNASKGKAEHYGLPVPLPRKAKCFSQVPQKVLRKSASYTMLVQETEANSTYENVSFEKCQTLPRFQPPEAEVNNSPTTVSHSSSTSDLSHSRGHISNDKRPSGHKYEMIYPINHPSCGSQTADLVDEFKLSLIPQGKTKTHSQPVDNATLNLLEDYKLSLPSHERSARPEISPKGSIKLPRSDLHHSKGVMKLHIHERTKSKETRHTSNINPIEHGKADAYLRGKESAAGDSLIKPLSFAREPELQISDRRTHSSTRQNQSVMKISQPSRKTQHAPPPPSALTPVENVEGNLNTITSILDRVAEPGVKKSPSRKTGRAPEPPKLQKSATMVASPSVKTENCDFEDSIAAMYAKVQKPKLHALIENISDSQCGVRLNKMDNPSKSNHPGKNTQNISNYGLQHSHSDASVFLALRTQKYQRKNNVQSFRKPTSDRCDQAKHANPLLSSSSGGNSSTSSDSDNSSININSSDEQKLKHAVKGKNHMPVAPPRSKRRSTTEVHFLKDAKGFSNIGMSSSSLFMQEGEDIAPVVPVKSRGAFEIPDDFKPDVRSRRVGDAERSKSRGMKNPVHVQRSEKVKSEKSPVVYRKY